MDTNCAVRISRFDIIEYGPGPAVRAAFLYGPEAPALVAVSVFYGDTVEANFTLLNFHLAEWSLSSFSIIKSRMTPRVPMAAIDTTTRSRRRAFRPVDDEKPQAAFYRDHLGGPRPPPQAMPRVTLSTRTILGMIAGSMTFRNELHRVSWRFAATWKYIG